MNVIDQTGRTVSVPVLPQRIISLVPSQTELLYDLQLDNRVVGITRFCVHPPAWRNAKRIIGGTKQFDFDIIHALKPDLIIGNKEENFKNGIEELACHYPVWMSDIFNLDDALAMIRDIGAITGSDENATILIRETQESFSQLKRKSHARVLYLIWRKPWMGIGSNTFINFMIESMGWENCLAEIQRYPEISSDEIVRLSPDIILLSSEPFPFKEKHVAELKAICPQAKLCLVDGEMFSWYGSRLRIAPAYLNSLVI